MGFNLLILRVLFTIFSGGSYPQTTLEGLRLCELVIHPPSKWARLSLIQYTSRMYERRLCNVSAIKLHAERTGHYSHPNYVEIMQLGIRNWLNHSLLEQGCHYSLSVTSVTAELTSLLQIKMSVGVTSVFHVTCILIHCYGR